MQAWNRIVITGGKAEAVASRMFKLLLKAIGFRDIARGLVHGAADSGPYCGERRRTGSEHHFIHLVRASPDRPL